MPVHNDSNAKQIVKALRDAGAVVYFWIAGQRQAGQPDLVCGFRGVTYLIEVKGAKGALNEAQETWHRRWTGGPLVIVRTEAEALAAIGIGV